ncbi:hypothetical protein CRG98_009231 [Punica granatum]|uniref:Strictosidine synthase conserved region domain-containing protein n=1 Tax=Punica granatum TaxID=22663 RepID=A0A2I0KPE4_PUNGR|nr:hypothetical protein CRG98_009231 [Punica granatum]
MYARVRVTRRLECKRNVCLEQAPVVSDVGTLKAASCREVRITRMYARVRVTRRLECQLQGVAPVTRLQLPPKAIGPEALAFNQAGRGPFVGRMDHSLIHVNYIDLCYCRNQNRQNSVVGLDGRNPNLVASSAEGVRFTFLNGLDIDQNSEVVFFADTSSIFPRSQANAVVLTRDMTGRLLSYNPRTKELKVLLRGLAGPNGVAVSRGGSFLFFTEIVTMTIQ